MAWPTSGPIIKPKLETRRFTLFKDPGAHLSEAEMLRKWYKCIAIIYSLSWNQLQSQIGYEFLIRSYKRLVHFCIRTVLASKLESTV